MEVIVPPAILDHDLRAAIYDRVSKDTRRDATSVRNQHQATQAACAANGWLIAGTYTDNHRSASRFATRPREDWERLLEDLGGGLYDVLVLWESSRGDRELEMWARLLNLCRRRGILIHVTTHHGTYDMQYPRGRRALADDGVNSAYEVEKTSHRIRRDILVNARRPSTPGATSRRGRGSLRT
ncbi:recombinase family protein [Nonomuraea endophytica]|uniref:recombinase family protein n=1 Tax=Nonomuraea endophytica TaxID=714136 RepID=UPI0037CB7407